MFSFFKHADTFEGAKCNIKRAQIDSELSSEGETVPAKRKARFKPKNVEVNDSSDDDPEGFLRPPTPPAHIPVHLSSGTPTSRPLLPRKRTKLALNIGVPAPPPSDPPAGQYCAPPSHILTLVQQDETSQPLQVDSIQSPDPTVISQRKPPTVAQVSCEDNDHASIPSKFLISIRF